MALAQQQPGKRDIYQRSGIQFLPFNTLYQLRALTEQQPELIPHIAHALLMPDYFSYRLTGRMNWEYTNATTTQLVNINSDDWDETLLAWSGANKAWFGRPTHPVMSLVTGFARKVMQFLSSPLPAMTPPARLSPRR